MLADLDDPHARRRARDRADQAARRAAAKASGERVGHALDALVIDGLALMLAGRPADDPVRIAFQRSMSRAFRARGVKPTPAIATRLQSRLSIGATLRLCLDLQRADSIGTD